MSDAKSVLLIGFEPAVVDYSKWPGLTPEKLLGMLEADRDRLNALGYRALLWTWAPAPRKPWRRHYGRRASTRC